MTIQDYFRDMCGYELKTTFWEDFSIADFFGIDAVKQTYKRAFEEWKSNYEYLTELVMILNHKSWQYAEKNPALSQVYVDLFYESQDYGYNNLKDEELSYFIRTLD